MTDHSELIARLENSAFSPASPAGKDEREAAAALREQAGEIEKLRREHDAITIAASNEEHDNDTLASENAGLRKDAERYRWLRDDTMADDLYEILEMIGGAEGSTLDARIDAAMEPKSKP